MKLNGKGVEVPGLTPSIPRLSESNKRKRSSGHVRRREEPEDAESIEALGGGYDPLLTLADTATRVGLLHMPGRREICG